MRWEEYVAENALEDEFCTKAGKYKTGVGKVVSKAILDGLWPAAFAHKVCTAIAFDEDAVKADPPRLFDIIVSVSVSSPAPPT